MVERGIEEPDPHRAAMEIVLPWLEEAIDDMRIAELPSAVGLADFGCPEGSNSIRAMHRLIPALRKRSARPIHTIHADLPDNAWGPLLSGLRRDGGSAFGEGVFSSTVAGSLFEPLLPPASVHVAMTFEAIGSLSRRPVERLPGYILPNGPSRRSGVGNVAAQDAAACAAQASADVESFLRARADEIVPGGKLLIQVFGADGTVRASDGIYDALNAAVLEVLEAGLIGRTEYEAYYEPIYVRTLDELTEPVTPDGGLAPLFRLDRSATYEVDVPFVEACRRTGDAAAFARSYTRFLRASTESGLRAAFPADSDRIAREVYERAERLIRTEPERFPFRYVAIAALLTRRETSEGEHLRAGGDI